MNWRDQLFSIPGILSIVAIGYLYYRKDMRTTMHLLPYALLVISGLVFFFEYGKLDLALFGTLVGINLAMHAAILWEYKRGKSK